MFSADYQLSVEVPFGAVRNQVPYGLVPELAIANSTFAADLPVLVPVGQGFVPAGLRSFKPDPVRGGTADVVGVLDSFSWGGRPSDPIALTFLMSQPNATQLQSVLTNSSSARAVNRLDWWVAGYDRTGKSWFDQAYPDAPVAATVAGSQVPELTVSPDPIRLPATNVQLFAVSMRVVPNRGVVSTLHFATARTQRLVMRWGTAG